MEINRCGCEYENGSEPSGPRENRWSVDEYGYGDILSWEKKI